MEVRSNAILKVIVSGLLIVFSAGAFADPLTVKTDKGKVHGKAINNGKVNAFLGIPYAAPPVGAQRWRVPGPAAKWKGTRDASNYGARCVQGQAFADMVFQDAGENEDCLYLNVFAPADAKSKSMLPVMFWIYGGGYRGGSASEPRHNGDFIPTKGVVLVTFNYRLGVFGFLATTDLAKEANGTAGNYGLMDMIAALQWVKANIAGFGGDPGNVTIFGESAGSNAVSTLMASPMARGLFHKAIGESGSALGGGTQPVVSFEDRLKRNQDWVVSLGINSLADLRAVPADKLLEDASKPGTPSFSAVVDGRVLTESVADTFAAGKQAHVPLIAGWNRDEGAPIKDLTVDKWKTWAADHLHDRAAEFLTLYPGDTDEQAARSSADLAGDTFTGFSTWKWIVAHKKTGDSPVYRYHLELAAPPSKFHQAVAFHSDDIEYIFGTLDTRPGAVWRPEDRTLSEQMMTYWTNFAKTGDPNGPGVPMWPKLGTDNIVLHLDSPTTAAPSTVEGRYEFLMQGLPSR